MPSYMVTETVVYIVEGSDAQDAYRRFMANPEQYVHSVDERHMQDENGEHVETAFIKTEAQ